MLTVFYSNYLRKKSEFIMVKQNNKSSLYFGNENLFRMLLHYFLIAIAVNIMIAFCD